jgi:hypothetical protein
MKLAEALILRADLQKIAAQLEQRMKQNAKAQEGDEPPEAVEDLISQYEGVMSELAALIARINRTNHSEPLGGGTLAEAITRRDCLKAKLGAYRELLAAASVTQDRYSRSEVRFVRCVDVAELQSRIDRLSKEYRELDTKMQGMNWTVDLAD